MSDALILTVDGSRVPPSGFTRQLERFDPNLRVRWGMGQAFPFPGWIIERKIPEHMKKRLHESKVRKMAEKNPHWDSSSRYADQVIVDEHGNVVLRRAYDMLPDWHEVYRAMDKDGNPILELGEFVIDYLRRHYDRTLLGFPELGKRQHLADQEERRQRELRAKERRIDEAADAVMAHRHEIFPEILAFGGQPRTVKEGTEL